MARLENLSEGLLVAGHMDDRRVVAKQDIELLGSVVEDLFVAHEAEGLIEVLVTLVLMVSNVS